MKIIKSSAVLFSVLLLTGCLTINQKKILPAPFTPEYRDTAAATSVLYLSDSEINLDSYVYALKLSHGLTYNEEDASLKIALASDNKRVYFRAEITDDILISSELAPADAWNTDSIEVFIGQDNHKHTTLNEKDHAIRVSLLPDGRGQLGFDNVLVKESDVIYNITDTGAIVTFSVSLEQLGWDELKDGDVIRAEYCYNDSDSTARDMKLQWTGSDDMAYADASKWGNVQVKEVK